MDSRQSIPSPVFRKLRVFAVDPGLAGSFETAVNNEMTVSIAWEKLERGPVGEYVAVLDVDANDKEVFPGVDLDDLALLAQDGLAPSDGSPQFHQQMVYAVAMKTIESFERALGRKAHWEPERTGAYRSRLPLRPHAFDNSNAYYDPRGGLSLGYFESSPESQFPGTTVFTCLSQDVIAHELTHALVMGMGIDAGSDANPDAFALHEGLADVVALLQHFNPSEVLREQIAAARGNLGERTTLGAIALQLGQALGKPDGLRNAFGHTDAEGNWQPRRPHPGLYAEAVEPHERGDVLVGAVFEAFRKIYESRVADLKRIASKGTGVLTQGDLHPDLVARMAAEASKSARHVLDMCIRALDYLPATDVTFGDYLRAILTADHDLVPYDEHRYRLAFVDAFRSYGIVPAGTGTVAVDTMLWPAAQQGGDASAVSDFVRDLIEGGSYWTQPREREKLWRARERRKTALRRRLAQSGRTGAQLGAIDLKQPFRVRSFDLRQRTVAGKLSLLWVVKIAQASKTRSAGCTLLIDAETGAIRYQIEKATPAPRTRSRGARSLLRGLIPATPAPTDRKLRVFAFDPSVGVRLETVGLNEITLRVPWERDADGGDALGEGPVGEYVEVIDRDPASGVFYEPVDLNDWRIVAQDGLPPSESNPQFHQQMVYAVAMRTIRHFERSLGRLVLWSPRRVKDEPDEYVPRLRIYPHALREANAYYSPDKKALLFGYFPSPRTIEAEGATPPTVFTCLSHDVIAHEVTHALLDGIHRRFDEPSNPDVLAFHEAFADIVALFLRFSLPEVVRHQIAATRGDLASQNQLGELAQQVGEALGKRGALRSAIGERDENGKWVPLPPDPEAYQRVLEPHGRGAILVAAVFDAFLTIYKARVADLLRIATEGTGVLPAGHLHPDLVNRLADEAADSALHVLQMCIRGLDYCPPVDVTFGDYLRAIVTADAEFDPVDEDDHRVAFAEAFRRRGIVPEDVRTLSVDGLLWPRATPGAEADIVVGRVKSWARDIGSWNLSRNRQELFELMEGRRAGLQKYLRAKMKRGDAELSAIDQERKFEVHSMRPTIFTDSLGHPHFQWIVELTQYLAEYDGDESEGDGREAYRFRWGTTLLIDAETGEVRYSIDKPKSKARRERERRYRLEEGNESLAALYFGGVGTRHEEPFAMLHRF